MPREISFPFYPLAAKIALEGEIRVDQLVDVSFENVRESYGSELARKFDASDSAAVSTSASASAQIGPGS